MILTSNYDLPLYANKFLRHLQRQHYSSETITAYHKDLKRFNAFLFQEYDGNILLEEIQKEDILDFMNALEDQGLKPNTVFRHLSTLKSLYKFLVYEMDFKVDVAARIKHRAVYTPLPEPFTFEEIECFLKACEAYSKFYHVFFSLMYYTGSRISPICSLLKEHVDLKQQKIYFPKIKFGKDLHLPLHDNIYPLISNFLIDNRSNGSSFVFNSPIYRNKAIGACTVRKSMKKIAKSAGITRRVFPHILRHTTATHLTLLDVDQKFIASILGHSDLRSTARYQQLNVENLRDKLNHLN